MAKTVKPNGRGASAPNKSGPKKAASKKKAKASASGVKKGVARHYIRNLHGGAGGARLGLTDGTEIHLAPRGQVGDLILVSEDQRDDPIYQRNLNFLFEELSHAQGLEVIDKQNTNAQAHRASPMDHITNELGQKYVGPATITETYEAQGQVVGAVSQAADGQSSLRTGNIERPASAVERQAAAVPSVQPVMGPQQVNVPGGAPVGGFNPDIMPSGISTEQAEVFLQTPREQRQALIEQWQSESMENHRNELTVTMGPPQRG